METACLRYTQIPNTSRLFSDFQYHFNRVSQWYGHDPADPESFRRAAGQIDYPEERRAALVQALSKANGGSPSLELLSKPGTVAVVTGQQAGLFSGPAYTIYKALTAAVVARRLTEAGIPAVPVFWLATEDHDFAEIDHCFVFDERHQPVRLRAEGDGGPQQPVGSIPLRAIPLSELEGALEGLPFSEEVIAAVRDAYVPGETFGAAFKALLRHFLRKLDLLYVDPLDPGLRAIVTPFLRSAVESAGDLKTQLLERNRELTDAGYHAQVHIDPQTSLLFQLDGDRRVTLRSENGDYVSRTGRLRAEELAERAESLSPNALLRPVMQDYLLPTVAYVGGPAELAYLAQSEVIYRALLGRMPVVLARSSFTLVDARANKLLHRYGFTVPDLFHPAEELRQRIGKALVPGRYLEQLAGVRAETAQNLEALRTGLIGFDPTLAAALDKSQAKILYQLDKIGRKTEREALRRDERAQADAEYLTGTLFPEKHLQERYYSILPFLAEHGPGLIDALETAVHPECPDHKIVTL